MNELTHASTTGTSSVRGHGQEASGNIKRAVAEEDIQRKVEGMGHEAELRGVHGMVALFPAADLGLVAMYHGAQAFLGPTPAYADRAQARSCFYVCHVRESIYGQ